MTESPEVAMVDGMRVTLLSRVPYQPATHAARRMANAIAGAFFSCFIRILRIHSHRKGDMKRILRWAGILLGAAADRDQRSVVAQCQRIPADAGVGSERSAGSRGKGWRSQTGHPQRQCYDQRPVRVRRSPIQSHAFCARESLEPVGGAL